jgi:catechol 2,3-dioxygenase-like lactoylglutathione lyase family enzyme
MTITQTRHEHATEVAGAATVDLKLEAVAIPVADVDRAKHFYESIGWRLDIDFVMGKAFRGVQLTPPGSSCSIHIGKGVTTAVPGTAQGLFLVVDDIEAARTELLDHGVDVSEPFHFDDEHRPIPGLDPERASYRSYATFSDPDGNRWVLQEVRTRLPGRGVSLDLATLTELLREAEMRHGEYEASAPKHHWSDWYAAYIIARERGRNPEESARDGARHMERLTSGSRG